MVRTPASAIHLEVVWLTFLSDLVEVEENINLDLDGGGAHVAIIDDLGLGGEGIDGGDLGIRMPLPCHHLRGWR